MPEAWRYCSALLLRALLITESRRSILEGAAARMAVRLSRYKALRRRRCRSRCASHSSTLQVAECPEDSLLVVAECSDASVAGAAEPAAEFVGPVAVIQGEADAADAAAVAAGGRHSVHAGEGGMAAAIPVATDCAGAAMVDSSECRGDHFVSLSLPPAIPAGLAAGLHGCDGVVVRRLFLTGHATNHSAV